MIAASVTYGCRTNAVPGMPEATKARYCAARGAAVHAEAWNPNPDPNPIPDPNPEPNSSPSPNPNPNSIPNPNPNS